MTFFARSVYNSVFVSMYMRYIMHGVMIFTLLHMNACGGDENNNQQDTTPPEIDDDETPEFEEPEPIDTLEDLEEDDLEGPFVVGESDPQQKVGQFSPHQGGVGVGQNGKFGGVGQVFQGKSEPTLGGVVHQGGVYQKGKGVYQGGKGVYQGGKFGGVGQGGKGIGQGGKDIGQGGKGVYQGGKGIGQDGKVGAGQYGPGQGVVIQKANEYTQAVATSHQDSLSACIKPSNQRISLQSGNYYLDRYVSSFYGNSISQGDGEMYHDFITILYNQVQSLGGHDLRWVVQDGKLQDGGGVIFHQGYALLAKSKVPFASLSRGQFVVSRSNPSLGNRSIKFNLNVHNACIGAYKKHDGQRVLMLAIVLP